MPIQFFTDAERQRLNNFPLEIQYQDLATFFTLSETDKAQIPIHRPAYNRLGFAIQLSTLRFMGFVPDNLQGIPPAIVDYLARQLDVMPDVLAEYGTRSQTRTEHLRMIMQYIGFRRASEEDLDELSAWLVSRAQEHDKPSLLYELACDRLRKEKIIRPGVTILERLIAESKQKTQNQTMLQLAPILTDKCLSWLNSLLIPDKETGKTLLSWLRQSAPTNSPNAILNNLEKLTFLKESGVLEWDVSSLLNPNRMKRLAQIARESKARALRRSVEERRYPILMAFLYQSLLDITDETVDMFERCLGETDARSRGALDRFRKSVARATNEKVRFFSEIGNLVLDESISDVDLRQTILSRIPKEKLQSAVEESERIARPLDDSYFDFIDNRYSYLRQFTPDFLSICNFRSNISDDPLLEAIDLLRHLNDESRRVIPDDAPIAFVPPKWYDYVIDKEGKLNRHYYELCALWELKNALRSGDIWIDHSRHYANPETYLIPKDLWIKLKPEVCQQITAPQSGHERLMERKAELEGMLTRVNAMLASDGKVRLDNGELVISPIDAEDRPESVIALEQRIDKMLPQIELTNLLIEVDRWTHFSEHFYHADGSVSRNKDFLLYLYASILSQGCNLGLTKMAQIASLSYDQLIWCNNWHIREETLKDATPALVNFHYHQPLTQHWGGGTLSSSDGQRFPVSGKVRIAEALPRYFGYGKGVVFYTWTSDQYSQYGTKVIPATVRDATYVLDEILDNETELPIVEHTTDTSGYTEIVFALFDLLGMQFSPRIRDIGDQHLYRPNLDRRYPNLESQLMGRINWELIEKYWDALLRVAGSLKMGWVTASLFISKQQSYPRQSALTRALQEYGRLAKTLFILRYLESESFRRYINRQLNKGESLHMLRRFLFFAHEGKIQRKQEEEMNHQAGCLNLITNAVIVWNTVYMNAAIKQLKSEGYPVADEDLRHLSPARYAHVNPYGRFIFEIEEEFNRKELRPLRRSR